MSHIKLIPDNKLQQEEYVSNAPDAASAAMADELLKSRGYDIYGKSLRDVVDSFEQIKAANGGDFLPGIFKLCKRRKCDLTKLKENTAYLARVACNGNNPIHHAVLFTGFHNGSYAVVYINNYHSPIEFSRMFTVYAEKELCTFK